MADAAGAKREGHYITSSMRPSGKEVAVKLNLVLLLMIAGAAIAAILLGPQASAAAEPPALPVGTSGVYVVGS